MQLTVYVDLTCPLSFLAVERAQRIEERRLARVAVHPVVGDPRRPVTGQRLDELGRRRLQAVVEEWVDGDEPRPVVPPVLSHAGPLTAALAESVGDGVDTALLRRLLDALWRDGEDLSDAVDVRRHVAHVMSGGTGRIPLGIGHDEAMRRMGGTTTRTGVPVSAAGYRQLRSWQQAWERRGRHPLPLVVTALGEALPAAAGLELLLALAQGERPRSWPSPVACPVPALA